MSRADPYELREDETGNPPRPPGAERFARAIERLGRDAGLGLRLVWAPDVERFFWGRRRKVYAVRKCRQLLGWMGGEMIESSGKRVFKQKAYFPSSSFPDISPDGACRLPDGTWIVPDWKYWEVSFRRWVIEERLPDRERAFHEENRYEYDPDTGDLVDALGPWPKDGKWACIEIIAHHWIRCCEEANSQHRLCYGIGRDPQESDLEEVRERIAARNERLRLRSNEELPTEAEYAESYREETDALREGERRMRDRYQQIFENEINPTIRAALTPQVDLGDPIRLDTWQKRQRELFRKKKGA